MADLQPLDGKITVHFDDKPATDAANRQSKALSTSFDKIDKDSKKAEKALDNVGKAAQAQSKAVIAAANAEAKAVQALANIDIEKERTKATGVRTRATTRGIKLRTAGDVERIEAREARDIAVQETKQTGKQQDAIARFQLENLKQNNALERTELKDHLSQRREIIRRGNSELSKDSSRVDAIMRRALGASPELQREIQAAIGGHVNQARRFAMRGTNFTTSQAFNQQLSQKVGAANAAYLVGGGARTTAFGGGAGGRGGGNLLTRLLGGGGGGIAGGVASGLLGGLGVGVGGYALAGVARGVGEDIDRATAYERQTIAARNLAGSQAKLNELLAAYATASGNVVDKVTSLNNATRLMATGFANSVPEMEQFVRATRGASIALGKPQDYVIQETQLAISNVSKKRLDQIGLGIREVDERIEKLRQTNKNWSRETAFQNAVLDLMDEKYGKLTKTAEGQATGVEKLRKSWADLRLEMGKAAKGPAGTASSVLAFALEQDVRRIKETIDAFREQYDSYIRILGKFGMRPPGVFTKSDEMMMGGNWTDDSRPAVAPQRKGYTEEQRDLISDWRQKFLDLEDSYGKQRLQAVQQYETQRASLIRNYNKQNLREEQDFARGRARALRDYERAILDVMRESQEREAELQEDLDKKIADLNEGANDKLADIEKKYRKDREKAEKDHRDRLMKAAGQLDAIAVLEERKRWKRENEEREEGHKEAVEEVKDNLKEQIEEAREAHAERLEDARKADEKRLRDMAIARERQLTDENEDRAIQKARAEEDHNDALAEMDRLHAENMAKLATEYADQRELMVDEFAIAMHEAGVYIKGVAGLLVEKQKLEEEWLEGMVVKYEELLRLKSDTYKYDPKTGPQIPHEYGKLLNLTQPVTSSNISATNSTRTLVVNQGAFQVYTTPGMEEYVGQEIENTVIKLLEGS